MYSKLLRSGVILSFLTVFVFLALCETSAFAVKQGGILKIAAMREPTVMDPPNTNDGGTLMVGAHVFEQLARYYWDEKTKKLLLFPALAEKWEHSKDGKIWTFFLRKGVKFHDGTPFDAAAVKFNIDRLIADKPAAVYGRAMKTLVERSEVTDPLTVKIYLKKPGANLMNLIANFNTSMVSPEAVKKYGDKIGRNPTGTGSFKFTKWVPGESVELQANKEYWGEKAYLDGMIFRIVPDDSARLNMIQAGEVDVALNIPISEHKRLQKDPAIKLATWPTAMGMRIFIDCAYPPTNDVKVRQAMKYAIDTKTIVRDIFEGNARVSDSVISPFTWGYYPADSPAYDPEKAKKLLSEAGWVDQDGDGIREKGGKKLMLTLTSPTAGHYMMGGVFPLAIQEYLRKVGFDCKVIFMEWAALYAKLLRTQDQTTGGAFFIIWSTRTDASETLYDIFYSPLWYPDKKSSLLYRNTDYDKIIEKAILEIDPQKRLNLYKEAQVIIAHDNPMLTLWYQTNAMATRKNVHGIEHCPVPVMDNEIVARRAWLE